VSRLQTNVFPPRSALGSGGSKSMSVLASRHIVCRPGVAPFAALMGVSVLASLAVVKGGLPLWIPGLAAMLSFVLLRWGPGGVVALGLVALVFVPFRSMFRYFGEDAGAPLVPDFARHATAAAVEAIKAGSLETRLSVVLLFIAGMVLMLRRPYQLRRLNVLPWIAAYSCFAFASLIWSVDPALTARRAVGVAAIFAFAAGVGGVFYPSKPSGERVIFRTLVWVGFAAGLVVLAMEVASGEFSPLDPRWRFGRLGTENQTSWVTGLAFLVAYVTKGDRRVWGSSTLGTMLAISLALMTVATKSRFGWLGVGGGLIVARLLTRKGLARSFVQAMIAVLVLFVLAFSVDVRPYLTRAASDEVTWNLSGRIPLWSRAWELMASRSSLLSGGGYGAFWTGRVIPDLADLWVATSAHGGYLDEIGGLGVVGLGLVLGTAYVSIRNGLRLLKIPEHATSGLVLISMYTAVLLINVGESLFQSIHSPPMVALWIMVFIVSRRRADLRAVKVACVRGEALVRPHT